MDQIIQALQILDQDGVVGIPTETVYGLAARIDRPQGIAKIFKTKGRPLFDPLIVHVADQQMARKYCTDFSLIAETLANKFWPGPLTLILPKTDLVPDLVTAGLETVGLRMPRSPMTLELIKKAGVGLPAPSANRFGRTSPSLWEHVEQEFQGQVFVLKGPAAEVGIESTIVEINAHELTLRRPGMISKFEIEFCLKSAGTQFFWSSENPSDKSSSETLAEGPRVTAPGQLKRHYMPDVPLVAAGSNISEDQVGALFIKNLNQVPAEVDGVAIRKPSQVHSVIQLKLPADQYLAARILYKELRDLSKKADLIFYRVEDFMTTEAWSPVFERLTKATLLTLN